MNFTLPLNRHSRESGNPAKINIPRSGQNLGVVSLTRGTVSQLDSRLHGNDVPKGDAR